MQHNVVGEQHAVDNAYLTNLIAAASAVLEVSAVAVVPAAAAADCEDVVAAEVTVVVVAAAREAVAGVDIAVAAGGI